MHSQFFSIAEVVDVIMILNSMNFLIKLDSKNKTVIFVFEMQKEICLCNLKFDENSFSQNLQIINCLVRKIIEKMKS